MDKLYLICAIVGGTLFLCQLVLMIFGLGHGDHDVGGENHVGDHGHSDSMLWGLLSLRAIVAAVACFGLTGRAVSERFLLGTPGTFAVSLAAGLAAMLLVAVVLRSMLKLTADGTSRLENARGAAGTVYLSIPAERSGVGKVHLELQNRTLEVPAVTYQNAIPTGTRIVVTDVIAPDTVEVIAASQLREPYVAT